jgi:hypothetical protein
LLADPANLAILKTMENPDPSAALRAARAAVEHGDLEAAESMLRRSITGATSLHVLLMLAQVLRAQGKIEECCRLQLKLVELRPGNLVYRFDLAETLLLLGRFERGWREYKYRYSLPATVDLARKVQRPRWAGQRLEGKTILIHDEQGFGDTFQFLRLLRNVREFGGRIILQVHAALRPFATRLGWHDVLLTRGQLPPPFDLHCELMSLPDVLGLRLEHLPGPIPYLTPDPLFVQKWQARLAALPRPIVALAWAGTPTHPNDHNRSLRLKQLAPFAAAKASLVTVQKGPAATQATAPPFDLLNLDPEIASFEDTAAILSIAELLVSVDSSPVHLAGALGRPVWTLLPDVPDWRWLLAREDTPWYPTMRLFRQRRRGDWTAVIAEAAAQLANGLPNMMG